MIILASARVSWRIDGQAVLEVDGAAQAMAG